MQEFTIHFRLPSLNEVILANRTNRYAGAKLKKDIETKIMWEIKFAKLKKVDKPCIICFTWNEENKRRDVDNIQSSQKFVLDALVKSGVLENDTQKYVKNTEHIINSDCKKSSVVVKIKEV